MIILLLAICWTPYVITRLLRAQHAQTPNPARPTKAHGAPSTGADTETAVQHGAWSALDDRQLTRLLTDSAPRSTPDRTLT
jgi:hypothetical protein